MKYMLKEYKAFSGIFTTAQLKSAFFAEVLSHGGAKLIGRDDVIG